MKVTFWKIGILLFLFFVIAAALLFLSGNNKQKVCFAKQCFAVEFARSPQERARGLMHRDHLTEQSGMLFVFDQEGHHSFWMKDTLIPLDMIFMDKERKVVFIGKNVQPCDNDPCPAIDPGKNVLFVLELNAGESDKYEIKDGDYADFKIPKISPLEFF